jgi:hypothetical protein
MDHADTWFTTPLVKKEKYMNKTEKLLSNRPFENVSEGRKDDLGGWVITFSFESKRVLDRETDELIHDLTESFAESLQCRFATSNVKVGVSSNGSMKPEKEKMSHIGWVLVHKVLEPDAGFGGCSCDVCSSLRDTMKAIREQEAQEYMDGSNHI